MIGQLNPQEKEAFIIGGGISGLLMGYRLKQLGYQIQIHEQSDRVGGLIQTHSTSFGLVETAAHSLMVSAELENFFKELQVDLQPIRREARARFIYRNQKMRRFPLGLTETISTLSKLFHTPTPLTQNATLQEWCKNYLGTAANDFLLSPFITGIFACTPQELDAELAFPQLIPKQNQSLFQHFRALKKSRNNSRPQMMTPVRGMQSLIDALAKNLKNEIHLNSSVTQIPNSPNVIYTTPAATLAKLIQSRDPRSASLLESLTYAPLITATAFFSKKSFGKKGPPRGVGVLIPRNEGVRILGVLFNSSAFENRATPDHVSLTLMLGGTQDPSVMSMNDSEIKNIIQKDAEELFSVSEPPLYIEAARWPKAIPLYSSHLKQTLHALKEGICNAPGQIVFSNYSGQVSIRGMIESLLQLN